MATVLQTERKSLAEINSSVPTAHSTSWRRWAAFAGPAYLVSIGYMDPGNWATDLEGGSRFGYGLLWVLVVSNAMAILLQTLSARLGIVTRRDLAQACRETYPKPVSIALWVLSEIAIAATDLAEVLGAAIALNLLFGIPLLWAVALTAIDSILILYLLKLGVQRFEFFIRLLVAAIGLCFAIQLYLAKPDFAGMAAGMIPKLNSESLYVAIGILGATVMPHNLYLHSSLVQTRNFGTSTSDKQRACKYNFIDSAVALNAALLVNGAILVLAAAVFHRNGIVITEIQQAHAMLSPLLGATLASVLFAVSLLLAGQASTLTGTLSGQIVMEGFLNLRLTAWLRRLITRMLAIIPAVTVIATTGEGGVYRLLILSQVILSLQLPFAIVPLIRFTSDRQRMGSFANKGWVTAISGVTAAFIILLNIFLVINTFQDTSSKYEWLFGTLIAAPLAGLLAYLIIEPFWARRTAKPAPSLPVEATGIAVEPEPPPLYQRILVPLDHSKSDRAALRHAASLAKQSDGTIQLLHVEEGATSQVYGPDSSTSEVTAGLAYLNAVKEELLKQSVKADIFIFHDNSPSAAIIRFAREHHPELIVMAAHGHGRFGDFVFGQTIDRVRHGVKIPVFIVQ